MENFQIFFVRSPRTAIAVKKITFGNPASWVWFIFIIVQILLQLNNALLVISSYEPELE